MTTESERSCESCRHFDYDVHRVPNNGEYPPDVATYLYVNLRCALDGRPVTEPCERWELMEPRDEQ